MLFPDCETMGIPVADGGEGTIDAVISVLHGSIHEVDVHGPLMEEVVSRYGGDGERCGCHRDGGGIRTADGACR